jgi:glycerophosphoryl diester phosphodiesterase
VRILSQVLILLSIISCKEAVKTPPEFDWQGHRGARGIYPENTIPAFLFALDQGVKTLELDVVITADSQVVASHEPFLNHEICLDLLGKDIDENAEKQLNIFRMTYEELSRYDCGSRVHPRFQEQQNIEVAKPLLSAVIEASEMHALETNREPPYYNIEVKSRPEWDGKFHPEVRVYADEVLSVIDEAGINDRVSIQSFDKRALVYLHEHRPEISLVLLEEDSRSPSSHLEELGFKPQVYSCYHLKVDKALVDYCHNQGMQVIPWTVNDRNEMKRLIEIGVDGIITDYPNYVPRFMN